VSKVQQFLQRKPISQREQTLNARDAIRAQRPVRHGPLSLTNLEELIAGLCDAGTVKWALDNLHNYMTTVHAIILYVDKLSVLFHALRESDSEEVITGILTFCELLAQSGEEFNLEGLARPEFVEVLLLRFPLKEAISIATEIVRFALLTARVVFEFNEKVDFIGFLTKKSLNLTDLLNFVCAFTLYEQFDAFCLRALPAVFDLCFNDDYAGGAISFLQTAALNRELRVAIGFSERFPEIFAPSDTHMEMKADLLWRVFAGLPDFEPILLWHGDAFVDFVAAAGACADADAVLSAIELSGLIASVGPRYAERLVELHCLDLVMGGLEEDSGFEAMSAVLVAGCRFLVHLPFEAQQEICAGGLFEALAAAAEALTEARLYEALAALGRARARSEELGDGRFVEFMTESGPLMGALEALRDNAPVKWLLRGVAAVTGEDE
jgi:hypothetical protein